MRSSCVHFCFQFQVGPEALKLATNIWAPALCMTPGQQGHGAAGRGQTLSNRHWKLHYSTFPRGRWKVVAPGPLSDAQDSDRQHTSARGAAARKVLLQRRPHHLQLVWMHLSTSTFAKNTLRDSGSCLENNKQLPRHTLMSVRRCLPLVPWCASSVLRSDRPKRQRRLQSTALGLAEVYIARQILRVGEETCRHNQCNEINTSVACYVPSYPLLCLHRMPLQAE